MGDTDVRKEKPIVRDMKEIGNTVQKGKKMSGVQDIKLLDKLENAKRFQSAATQIKVRNVKIKIKDIEKEQGLRMKPKKMELMTQVESAMVGDK